MITVGLAADLLGLSCNLYGSSITSVNNRLRISSNVVQALQDRTYLKIAANTSYCLCFSNFRSKLEGIVEKKLGDRLQAIRLTTPHLRGKCRTRCQLLLAKKLLVGRLNACYHVVFCCNEQIERLSRFVCAFVITCSSLPSGRW